MRQVFFVPDEKKSILKKYLALVVYIIQNDLKYCFKIFRQKLREGQTHNIQQKNNAIFEYSTVQPILPNDSLN